MRNGIKAKSERVVKMPSYSGQGIDASIDKISERLDYCNDEVVIRELLENNDDPKIRAALLRLKEVIKEWRRT